MIWSTYRQWMGNFLPFVAGSLALVLALQWVDKIVASLVAVAVLHQSINLWGFFENQKIERELRRGKTESSELVGFVYDRPPSILDAHGEVGLFRLEGDSLFLETENRVVTFSRSQLTSVRRASNIHSMIFLGGWVLLEFESGENLKLESRKFPTMWRSKLRTDQLFKELMAWHKKSAQS